MRLEDLRVLHQIKRGDPARLELQAGGFPSARDAVFMDSCLRRVWIGDRSLAAREGLELYEGATAYSFLLRVASGLESRIVGETDVFGQLKQAWKTFEAVADTEYRSELGLWVQRLFEDTKEIRSQYLQNLGGASYGSLLRKLMREQPGGSGEPVLLVGAGQLALSIAPYLSDFEVWITNRSPEKLIELEAELRRKPDIRIRVLKSEAEVREGWAKAAQAVLCIPYDHAHDTARIEGWKVGGAERPVYHLGDMSAARAPWTALKGYRSLEDLFELEKSQGQVRLAQLSRARRACEEKAKLRLLGGSLSIAHGWEDLASFA